LSRLFALGALAWCLAGRAVFAAAPPPLDRAVTKRIDAVFADLDRKDSPGCALGVFREGATLYSRGYGMANLEHAIANSPSTVLDLPEMPAYSEKVTIQHLIRHTSGLRDYTAYLSLAGWRTEDVSTADEAFDLITRQKGVNHRPGHGYLYCNTGYFLLSRIVERASGQSLRDFPLAEGALHIRARSIVATPLRPVASDRFVVDDLELVFERDPGGRIRGFRLSEDRIRDIGFTRQSDLAVD
jgi:CubicO group peptidase (beta-lactamase class C family)